MAMGHFSIQWFRYSDGDGGGSPCEDDENLTAVSKAFPCGQFT